MSPASVQLIVNMMQYTFILFYCPKKQKTWFKECVKILKG
jgi:hypothetical protein